MRGRTRGTTGTTRTSRTTRTRKGAGAVAVIAALALPLSGCGAFSSDDGGKQGEDRPSGAGRDVPTGRLLGKVRAPQNARPATDAHSRGFWLYGGMFAESVGSSVAGYRASDAQRKWSLRLKGAICAVSREKPVRNKIAVVYKGPPNSDGDSYCTETALVDLAGGKKVWEHRSSVHEVAGDPDVAIAGNTVVANGRQHEYAWRLGDGKPLWKRKTPEHCQDKQYVGGNPRLLVVQRWCAGKHDPDSLTEVVGADPRIGHTKFRYRGGTDARLDILSSRPVVLAEESDGKNSTNAVALDKDGRVRSRFPVEAPKERMVVTSDRLYSQKRRKKGKGDWSAIRAFDLSSGKVKKEVGFRKRSLTPMRMQGGKLLAYVAPPLVSRRSHGGAVISIDPKTFETTEIMRNSAKSGKAEHDHGLTANAYFQEGRLFLDQPAASGEGGMAYSTLVFGRK